MMFTFIVEIEVERTSGKFASRDEIGAQLLDCLEQCDEGSWDGAEGGEYETLGWDVTEETRAKKKGAA